MAVKVEQRPVTQLALISSCQSGLWKSAEKLQVFTDSVVPNVCAGTLAADWTCSGIFYIDIVFPVPFALPPKVTSSISTIGPYSPCMTGASDATYTSALMISTTGFRLVGAASPITGCTYDMAWGTAMTSYIAVGVK